MFCFFATCAGVWVCGIVLLRGGTPLFIFLIFVFALLAASAASYVSIIPSLELPSSLLRVSHGYNSGRTSSPYFF